MTNIDWCNSDNFRLSSSPLNFLNANSELIGPTASAARGIEKKKHSGSYFFRSAARGPLEDSRSCTKILDSNVGKKKAGVFKKIFGGVEDDLNEAKRKMNSRIPVEYDDNMEELRSKCMDEQDEIICRFIDQLEPPLSTTLKAILYLIEDIIYEQYKNGQQVWEHAKVSPSGDIEPKKPALEQRWFGGQDRGDDDELWTDDDDVREEARRAAIAFRREEDKWKNIKLIFQKKFY